MTFCGAWAVCRVPLRKGSRNLQRMVLWEIWYPHRQWPFVRCTLWDYYVYIYIYIIYIYIYIIIIYIYISLSLSLPSISLLYSHDINNQPPATYSYGNHHVFYAKPQSYISRGRPYPEASWRKRRWLWPLATTTRSSLWCNWVPLWRLAATRSRASMLFHWKTVII